MKKTIALITLFVFCAAAMPAVAAGPTSIRVAPPAPKFTDAERQAELARRRAAVAAKMRDNSMLVLFSAEPKIYSNSVNYVYRQENNLYYLTALKQAGATLVIAKNGGGVTELLFLPKRSPLYEAWEGKMYSIEQAAVRSGLKTIVYADQLEGFLDALRRKASFSPAESSVSIPAAPETLYMLLPKAPGDKNGHREFRYENEVSKTLSDLKLDNAQLLFADLRQIKSPYEIKLLQHAVDITTEAQMRAMATVGRAEWEYQVHAEVEYTFRRRNADYWGYPSIVGCGANATTLHYVESQGEVRKGDVLLMDVGAEYDHYTADVTRTFPVTGKFSKEQAEIYQIVYDAQEAAAKATKPGATFAEISRAADEVIKEGLFRIGLTTDKDSDQHKRWFIHGLGHWLGMNVHDVGSYGAPLKPGMVFTNEPGIYIREDTLDNLTDKPENKAFIEKVRPAFEKYKNIGVRIEDDLLVTETGVEWMTKDLPRTIADIEAFMAVAPKQVPLTARSTGMPVNIFFDQSATSFSTLFMDPNETASGQTMRSGFLHLHQHQQGG